MEYFQFIAGIIVLVFSGKYLVQGGVSIAKHFKLSPLVIGITVIAFGTSAPELIVSINAAISGNPEISFGNVVGSNIANIALVLAITAMLIPIPVNRNSLKMDWPMMMITSILLYFFIINNIISYYEGIILFALLLAYLYILLRKSKKDKQNNDETANIKQIGIIAAILLVVASSFGLAFGADFLVKGASKIALNWGVSKRVISITIVAFGTSIPELTTSIMAAIKKQTDISIGNIMGSNIFNICIVLGITSMIKGIPVDHIAFSFDIVCMLFISILLLLFIFPFKTIFLNRVEGAILFISYLIYISLVVFGLDFESILAQL